MHFPWVRKTHPCPKEKRDCNQTILSLPHKKHRHTLQSHWWSWFCWWVVLKIFTEKISCMQSEHYLVSQIARQLNAPLLSVSLYTYTHIRTHTDVHTYSHCPFCLCNEHEEHWWQQQCFHAGIKQGWLSQDLLFLLSNALPLVQGGETNGLDLERVENSL